MLLVLHWGRAPKFVRLLWIMQLTSLNSGNLSFVFPNITLELVFVIFPWPPGLMNTLCTFTGYLPKPAYAILVSAYRKMSTKWGEGICQ